MGPLAVADRSPRMGSTVPARLSGYLRVFGVFGVSRELSRSGEHVGESEVNRRGNLHGKRIPLDDNDATTGGLDEPGVVRGGSGLIRGAVRTQPMGGDEGGGGEALRVKNCARADGLPLLALV